MIARQFCFALHTCIFLALCFGSTVTMSLSPLDDTKTAQSLRNKSKAKRPAGTKCCVPLMKSVERGEHRMCGKASALGCCLQGQGSPYKKCSEYVQLYMSEEEISKYFENIRDADDVFMLEQQKTFSASLYFRMSGALTKKQAETMEQDSKQIAFDAHAYMQSQVALCDKVLGISQGVVNILDSSSTLSTNLVARRRAAALGSALPHTAAASDSPPPPQQTAVIEPDDDAAREVIKDLRQQLADLSAENEKLKEAARQMRTALVEEKERAMTALQAQQSAQLALAEEQEKYLLERQKVLAYREAYELPSTQEEELDMDVSGMSLE